MSFNNLEPLLSVLFDNADPIDFVGERQADGSYINYPTFVGTLAKDMGGHYADLMHMAVGVAGEAGELLDALKKCWVYGKEMDRDNVIEELGDLEFYMQGLRLLIGASRDEVLQANYVKLKQRYGDSYTDEKAIDRADKKLEIIDVTNPAQPVSDSDVAAMDSQAGVLK